MRVRVSNIAVGFAFVLMIGYALSTAGCQRRVKGEKMLSQEEAIEVAKEAFAKQGHAVSDYEVQIKTYHADEKQWIVWFEKIGPYRVPGGKHAVLVHKATGATVYMKGQ